MRPPRGQNPSNTLEKKTMFFGLLAFSLPMGSGGLKMAPLWPKTAPR